MVNKNAWSMLPASIKAVIRSAARDSTLWSLAINDSKNAAALEEIKQNTSVTLLPLPKPVLSALHDIAIKEFDSLSSADAVFKEVYESYSSFQRKLTPWIEIGEHAYMSSLLEQ